MPRLAAVPLDFEPGTQWAYSGQYAFDVLAHIVERASGRPFDEFARERIFEPLHMRDTAFYPDDPGERLATVYRIDGDTLVRQDKLAFENGRRRKWFKCATCGRWPARRAPAPRSQRCEGTSCRRSGR